MNPEPQTPESSKVLQTSNDFNAKAERIVAGVSGSPGAPSIEDLCPKAFSGAHAGVRIFKAWCTEPEIAFMLHAAMRAMLDGAASGQVRSSMAEGSEVLGEWSMG